MNNQKNQTCKDKDLSIIITIAMIITAAVIIYNHYYGDHAGQQHSRGQRAPGGAGTYLWGMPVV